MAYINPKFIPQKEIDEDEQRRTDFAAKLLGLKKAPIDKSGYRRRQSHVTQGGQEATNYETKKRNQREAAYLESLRKKIEQTNARTINVRTGDGGTRYFNVGSRSSGDRSNGS